jgi:uncharacterized cupin superfamily protein
VVVVPEGGIAFGELLDLVVLTGEGTHHADSGEVLLQGGRHGGFGLVGHLEHHLDPREEQIGAHGENRQQAQRHPGQAGVHPEQNRRDAGDQHDGAADLDHVAGEKDPQRLDVELARCTRSPVSAVS